MAKKIPKTLANPDYYEQDHVRDAFKDVLFQRDVMHAQFGTSPGQLAWRQAGCPREMSSHFPEDFGLKLPEGGGWIMVKHPPYAEIEVPPMSMWYATETIRSGVPVDGRKGAAYYKRHLARIVTDQGSLELFPDEYVLVKNIADYVGIEDQGVFMHFLGGTGGINEDAVFYAMTRGISRDEIVKMLIGEVTDSNAVYFTVHPGLAAMFGYAPEKEEAA